MSNITKMISILMADDDEDDRMMAEEAMEEIDSCGQIRFAENGQELLQKLRDCSPEGAVQKIRPDIILLDLNMPVKDGREALQEIKADPDLRQIPVVILTTSNAEEDISLTYDLGASSFITKPSSYEGLVKIMQSLTSYWANVTTCPDAG